MRIFLLLIVLFSSIFSPAVSPQAHASPVRIPDKIRVVIADGLKEISLSIRGSYRITTIETEEVLKSGRASFNLEITPSATGIDFGRAHFKIHAIQIIPEREPAIFLGKRLYRGSLQIRRTSEGLLRAINVVGLEDYLKGVLYHEVSHRWPMEAIRAQAIVSRTFALYQAQQNKDRYYYLKSDTTSQVYGGVYAERYRTTKAVEATASKVLLYRGRLLPAFFHATCGGRTEASDRLWNIKLPPLSGVACPYCKNSPHFFWEADIDLKDIRERLKAAGYNVSAIDSIKTGSRDASNRLSYLLLKGGGVSCKISAKDFRRIIGPDIVKSTNFTVGIRDREAYFRGYGWGHGVGMCQWGAFAMAKKGKAASEIVRYYYPGSRLAIIRGRS